VNTSLGVLRFEPPKKDHWNTLETRYDQEAKSWDKKLRRLGFCEGYRTLLAREKISVSKDRPIRIQDQGIGTGEASLALVESLFEQGVKNVDMIGVDISNEMLAYAQQKFEQRTIPFRGVKGNIESLPFQDGSIDIIISSHVLEHTQRPLKVLSESERVLAPDGTLILMMTRCNPITISIQKEWFVQCARSRKLSAVLKDFGLRDLRWPAYPSSPICNWLSFCCIARRG